MRTLVYLFLCFSVSQSIAEELSDARLSELLIGTWSARYIFENGTYLTYGEKTYHEDGTADGFISYQVVQLSGEYTEIDFLSYKSEWKIIDGVLDITNVVYYPPEPGSESEVIRDIIISIDSEKAVFESQESGEVFERFRLK